MNRSGVLSLCLGGMDMPAGLCWLDGKLLVHFQCATVLIWAEYIYIIMILNINIYIYIDYYIYIQIIQYIVGLWENHTSYEFMSSWSHKFCIDIFDYLIIQYCVANLSVFILLACSSLPGEKHCTIVPSTTPVCCRETKILQLQQACESHNLCLESYRRLIYDFWID